MFPLHTKSFPATPADLADLIAESVKRTFITAGDPVELNDQSYPRLESLRLNLDRAQLRPDPPRPPSVTGERAPALQVDQLRIAGSRLTLGPATADLRLQARAVQLDQARDSQDEIVLLLKSAADGEIEITADKSEIETAITAVATREAGKQGVTIQSVHLTLTERGPRSISAEVAVTAQKLFFSTVIRISADLDLDDDLQARLSGVSCRGDGAIGTLACGALGPHLEKLNNRTFPLLALPLGDVRLRDVRLAAGDKVSVLAQFGAQA